MRNFIVNNHRYLLPAVLFFGLFLRFVYLFSLPSEPRFPDSQEYISIARNLEETGSFVNSDGEKAARSPGYPLFLTMILSMTGDSFTAVRVVQVLIDLLSLVLLYFLVETVAGIVTGMFAATLYSIYPTVVYMTGTILSETLLIFFLISGLWLLMEMLEEGSGTNAQAAGAGILLGIAALIHPSYLLLPPLLFVLLIFVFRKRKHLYVRVGCAALFFLIAQVPWTVRNGIVLGGFVPGTTTAGKDLYEAFGPGATGGPRGHSVTFPEGTYERDELQKDRFLFRRGVHWMIKSPGRSLRLGAAKFFRTWSPFPNYSAYQTISYRILLFLPYMFCLVGFLIFWFCFRNGKEKFLLLAPILYVALVHSVFIGSIRYRVPVMPLIIVFAAMGWTQIFFPEQDE